MKQINSLDELAGALDGESGVIFIDMQGVESEMTDAAFTLMRSYVETGRLFIKPETVTLLEWVAEGYSGIWYPGDAPPLNMLSTFKKTGRKITSVEIESEE